MDSRARHRLLVLNHILAGELTAAGAAGYLQVSLRSVRRLPWPVIAAPTGPAPAWY